MYPFLNHVLGISAKGEKKDEGATRKNGYQFYVGLCRIRLAYKL